MCFQCAMVAVAAIGAAGIMRDRMTVALDSVERSVAAESRPSPVMFLLVLAALAERSHLDPASEPIGDVSNHPVTTVVSTGSD